MTLANLPQGAWRGSGEGVLDDRVARKCEKLELRMYSYNGNEFEFTMECVCEGISSMPRTQYLKLSGDKVLDQRGQGVGSFVSNTLTMRLPLDGNYFHEYLIKFTATGADFEQRMVWGTADVQRHYKGQLRKL